MAPVDRLDAKGSSDEMVGQLSLVVQGATDVTDRDLAVTFMDCGDEQATGRDDTAQLSQGAR